MFLHVAVAVTQLGESGIADLTLVRLLPRVGAVVLGEGGALCEALRAHVTLVGAVPGVRAQVRRDGAALRETALADGALERLFAAVHAQVRGEVGGRDEGFLADGALIRIFFVVQAEVHPQRRLACIRLPADVARVGPGERVSGGRSYHGATGNAERRRRRGVVEGTVRRLRVR